MVCALPSNAYARSEHLRALWPWLPLWTLLALLAIFSHGPMPLYSTRTLAVAWDMWTHHQWLVPHINGEPYSEKAPLLFWLIQAGWFVFGVNDIWPRVLEVGFGAIQLVLVAILGRRLFPARPWVAKAAPWMVAALGYSFLFGLQIMYDVMLAAWALGALLCLTPTARLEPRWLLFGLCIGLGLLTKGPVMLLHVLFPWLLGPLWSDWANQHRARWYGRGVLAVLLGFAMLLAWALPAGFAGGEAYRQRLFFTQTAGRVVDKLSDGKNLQNHAEPFWFYLLWLPALLFPFSGWLRAWVAVGALRRPLETGLRFALCWVIPALIVFSLISGKQLYYLLPELSGLMLLIAGAVALLRERRPLLAGTAWLGSWPLALASLGVAVLLFVLPNLVASGRLQGEFVEASVAYSRYFSVVFLLLGALLFVRGRGEMRRVAITGLVGALAFNTLFTLTAWPNYDLAPVNRLLSTAQSQHRAVAYLGSYDGQFQFAGRLREPIAEVHEDQSLIDFATAHPNGLVVTHPSKASTAARRYALLVQPFRSTWLVVWPAPTLVDVMAGRTPSDSPQPTQVYPMDARHGPGSP